MKKTLTLLTLFAIVIIQGCKLSDKHKPVYDLTKAFPGMQAMETRGLSDDEISIGKRICNAIKVKRVRFETLTNQEHKLLLSAESKSCTTSNFTNLGDFKAVLDNSNSTDMEYRTTARTDNFQEVITDASFPISAYCKAFFDDTKKVSNSVFEGEYKYIFVFKTIKNAGDTFDAYEMSRYNRNSKGEYSLQYAENNSIYTNAIQVGNSNLVGVERTRERFNTCKIADQYSVYRETFKSALTSFGN